MRYYHYILVAVAAFSVTSCTKEINADDSIVTGTGVYISRITMVDNTNAAPFDTIARAIYYYDAQKRPLKIEGTQTNSTGQITSKYIFNYEYAGTDTLATRSIEENIDYTAGVPTGSTKDTVNYVFSGGRCIYDSSYTATSGVLSYYARTYTYQAGNVIKYVARSRSGTAGTIYISEHTVRQTLTNGDISHQLDSSLTIVPAAPVSKSRLENTVTYISNPNPLARFSDPIRRPYFLDDIGIGSQQAAPKQLFTQHNYVYDSWYGAVTSHDQYTYQYTYVFRPDSYPSKIEETVNDNGTIRTYKYLLFYE